MAAGYIVEMSTSDDPFTPTWLDVSSRLLKLDTKRGRFAPLSRMEAGEATIILDDRAGLLGGTLRAAGSLDPFNPGGPWYGKLEQMRPWRVRLDNGTGAGGTDGAGRSGVIYGYVNPLDGWRPIRHGATGQAVQIEITDGSLPLSNAKMPGSALGLFIASPMPFAYQSAGVPLMDAFYRLAGAALPVGTPSAPLYDSGPLRRIGSAHAATGGQPPLRTAEDADGSLFFNGTDDYAVLVTGGIGTGPNWTVTFYMKCSPHGAGPAGAFGTRRLLWMGAADPNFGIAISVWESAQAAGNKLRVDVRGWDGASTLTAGGNGITNVCDGNVHRITVHYDSTPGTAGSGVLKIIDGATTQSYFGLPGFYYFHNTGGWVAGAQYGGPGWYNGWLDDVLFLTGTERLDEQIPDALDRNLVWGPYWPAAGSPIPVYTDDRARRVLDVAGWPAALRDVPARADAGWGDVEQLATGTVAANALEMVQVAMDAEGGAAWFRADGLLKCRGANALGGAVLATFGPGQIETEELEPTKGPVYNRVELTGNGAGVTRGPRVAWDVVSEGKYLPRTYRAELEVASDILLDTRAAGLLAALKAPVARVERITLAPLLDAGHMAQAQARELEDKVRAHYVAPSGAYSLDLDARIAGIEHHATREKARVVYWLDTY